MALTLTGATNRMPNRRYCYQFATVSFLEKRLFYAVSGHIALPKCLLRYVSHGSGSAQGAASRRRPLSPRALAAKIATSWFLRLIPTGFGSGRGSVRAKHGPQPASMRAVPAFRERLSDFEATNTGSFSSHGYNGRALQRAMARTVGRVRRSRHPTKKRRCGSPG